MSLSWNKAPPFLQLPAQCLGNALPNLLVTRPRKPFKTLMIRSTALQCFHPLHMLPASLSELRTPRRRLPASLAVPTIPVLSIRSPTPRGEGSVTPWGGLQEAQGSPCPALCPPQALQICFIVVLGGELQQFPRLCRARRLNEWSLFSSQDLSVFIP